MNLPEPYCNYWTPPTLTGFVAGNIMIGLAYYGIPLVFIFVLRQLKMGFDAVPKWVIPTVSQLGLFILFCGTSHFIEVFNVWFPVPILRSTWEVVTAAVSWSFLLTILGLIRSYAKEFHGVG